MKNNIQYKGIDSYNFKNKRFKHAKIYSIVLFILLILLINIKNYKRDIYNKNISLKKDETIEIQESSDLITENNEYYASNIDEEKIEFLKKVSKGAISSYREYGILPSITIAQAILESGWGESELAVIHNNLFGIKADSRWSGAVATISTSENYNNSVIANFRKYDSVDESIEDHGKFLYENPRYSECGLFIAKDYKSQAQALEDSGYSTVKDENGIPIYADKLIAIVEKYNLMQYDN